MSEQKPLVRYQSCLLFLVCCVAEWHAASLIAYLPLFCVIVWQLHLLVDSSSLLGLMLFLNSSSCLNSCPMNSPPLLCIIWADHGYRDSQVLVNSCVMFSLFLLLIWTIPNRLVTVPIIVKVLNSSSGPFNVVVNGPIRSNDIVCHGAMLTSRGTRCLYCLPWFLIITQSTGHLYCWHIVERPG